MVDQLPEQPELRVGADTDVTVARVEEMPIAEMLAELLGNRGIACRIVPSTSVHGRTRLEVRVARNDSERARDLLPHGSGRERRRSGTAHVIRTTQARRRVNESREDRVLDDVESAIECGDVELADRLLSSVEASDAVDPAAERLARTADTSRRSWLPWAMGGALAALVLVSLILLTMMTQKL